MKKMIVRTVFGSMFIALFSVASASASFYNFGYLYNGEAASNSSSFVESQSTTADWRDPYMWTLEPDYKMNNFGYYQARPHLIHAVYQYKNDPGYFEVEVWNNGRITNVVGNDIQDFGSWIFFRAYNSGYIAITVEDDYSNWEVWELYVDIYRTE